MNTQTTQTAATTAVSYTGGQPMTNEMAELKGRLKSTWMAGDYDYFSRFMEGGAAEYFDRLNLPATTEGRPTSILDIACGSGQLALIAARKGFDVTGVDISANWIESAKGRAKFEKLPARFDVGDAEALPYADASFDATASIFGAMFAPRPEIVASEMARVTRPGGVITMANWNAGGFIGKMFKLISQYIAPSKAMPSPVLWGDEETIRQRFGDTVTMVETTRSMYPFEYPFEPCDVVALFATYYGPTVRAFATLDPYEGAALREGLIELWSSHNTATDGTTRLVSEFVEVKAIRA